MATPITKGPHHVGLAVSKLEESAAFFTSVLGWTEVQRVPDYPAIFVSDGNLLVTLWATQGATPTPFDRHANVGLHHLAFQVASEAALNEAHERVKQAGARIEFVPQPVGGGPAKHLMCYEPSGIRIEFFWPGN